MSEFVQEKEAEESYAVRKKKELKKAKIQMKKNNEAVLGGVFNRHQRWFDDVTQNQENGNIKPLFGIHFSFRSIYLCIF